MPEAWLTNTTISHYRILQKLGAGGMGVVYLAQDTKLDRKVALKILPDDVVADHTRMRRFVQEAKAASALNHPNIITIHEIEQIDSLNFTATELIINNNLAHAYYLKNDLNSAIEQWQKLFELDPRFPNTPHNLGWAYLKQKRYEEATAEFQKAVDLSGRSSFLNSLGYCYAVNVKAQRSASNTERT